MPEEKEIPAAGENQDNGQAGEGQVDDQKDNSTDTGKETDGAGEGTNKGGEADNTNKGDDAGGGKTKKDAKAPEGSKKDDDEDDGKEPEQRKRLSTQDFIIGRQHKKLTKAAKAKEEGGNDDDQNNEDSEDDDDIDPDDEAVVSKVIAKKFAPILEKTIAADDEKEVQEFLKENPDFKEFEAKARRYMSHPSRRSLPIKSIFYEVAGDKLIKIGAERQKAADKKAKDSHTGGGSNRDGDATKSVKELSQDDFAKKQEEVRRGKR